ncbi:nitroreductase family protein [Ruminiclostridium cellulolyticum]|uniref:Nitroreductase n=1 Tax=Ruminiclostridium cellulolyticum (strain ATCC 35319 / DSM 5812 / JCM 6584 / H10) TaxID=394503 RepID=B8I657_RUMCH|nr:nitroreductase family protein [Ruminiclostridium cellulolyticum]ACL76822.1 nitroreductase [Ruminiclostridium cellulolyticum H10]
MSKNFYAAIKDRRTYYGIDKQIPVSDEKVQDIIKESVLHTPSAFNSQSARVVLLLGASHDKLWNITKDTLRKVISPENFSATEQKINSFRSGYGTVLFFEDNSVIESLQQQYATYKDNFPVWAQQSNGMLQYVIWTALEMEGIGASLQHYNPLIDDEVRSEWKIPLNWKLIAQMPFGKPTASPDEKQFQPIESRFKVFR